LQPTVAVLCAIRDGVADAREGRPPYTRTLFTQPDARRRLLRDACRSVGRLLVAGAVMDLLYQLIVFRRLFPLELVNIVVLLVLIPYLLARGPVNRLARLWLSRGVPT